MIRKYAEIFCWKNVSSFCSAKATHIFSAKNIKILYIESAKTVNEMTLNELVKLTTLWTTGPRCIEKGMIHHIGWKHVLVGTLINLGKVYRGMMQKMEACSEFWKEQLWSNYLTLYSSIDKGGGGGGGGGISGKCRSHLHLIHYFQRKKQNGQVFYDYNITSISFRKKLGLCLAH